MGVKVKYSVIIPTYRRPHLLRKCVHSLFDGILIPDEIVVVSRRGDHETVRVVSELESYYNAPGQIKHIWVSVPGHIPPVKKGVRLACGEIVAIIDDDVTVTQTWLKNITCHFSGSEVGVVGGRVILPGEPIPKLRGKPGQISWYGKYWKNLRHVNSTSPFEVASVMEGNSAWRRKLITSLEFSDVLNYYDAQMYGLDLCFQARKKDFKVLYDPNAVVYHHVAPRVPDLERTSTSDYFFTYSRNYTYVMLKHLPFWRKIAFLIWWFLIGERGGWGIGAIAVDTVLRGFQRYGDIGSALRGKFEGVRLGSRYLSNLEF